MTGITLVFNDLSHPCFHSQLEAGGFRSPHCPDIDRRVYGFCVMRYVTKFRLSAKKSRLFLSSRPPVYRSLPCRGLVGGALASEYRSQDPSPRSSVCPSVCPLLSHV